MSAIGGQVAASVGSNGLSLTLDNIKAPKNGYAYIYISNQSNNDVFFDNLQAGIVQGNIAEENHYYAYGLKIATLSSKKLGDSYEGTLKNNYLYNDKELFDDADLNWYDYGFRNYDPQIGRFTQLDPLTFLYPFYTPYQFAGCEPIANVDVDGLEPANVVNFMKGVERAGGSGIKFSIVAAGRWSGYLRVTYFKDGIAFARVFKNAGTLTNAVGKAVSLSGKVGSAIQTINNLSNSSNNRSLPGNNLTATTKPLNCHGAYQSGYIPDDNSGGDLFGWLRGNGGGYRFTGKTGSGEESRITDDPEVESRDISSLIELFKLQKSISTDLFKVKIPKQLMPEALDKLKKYMKVQADLEERATYFGVGNVHDPNDGNLPAFSNNYDSIFKKPGKVYHRRGTNFNIEVTDTIGGGKLTSKPAIDTIPR